MATVMCCGECGIEFSIPDNFYKERKEDGKRWFCPNGHVRVFRESDVAKLTRERDQLQQQIARIEDEKREAINAKDREIKLMKKRSAAGTCPCCQRTFSNMSTHMKKQHPDFIAESVAKIIPLRKRGKA